MSNTKKIVAGTIAGVSLVGTGAEIASADVVSPAETTATQTVAQKETQKQVDEHKALDEKHVAETEKQAEALEAEKNALPEKHENELNAFDKSAEKQVQDQESVVPNKEAQNDKAVQDAEKQMDKSVADKQKELDQDPARSAQEQRDQAQADKNKADKSVNDVADKTVQGAKDKQIADDKATKADEQKAINDSKAKNTADDKKSQSVSDKAVKDAKDKQVNSDKATKAEETKSVTDAQNKQKADDAKSKAVQKTADDKAKSVKDNDATIKADKTTKSTKDKQISDLDKTIDYKKKNKPVEAKPLTGEQMAKGDRIGTKYVLDPKTGEYVMVPSQPQATVMEVGNLPTKLHKAKLTAEQEKQAHRVLGYQHSKKDTTERVNGKLTAKQQAQINAYATTLVNSYLAEQGLPLFKTSKEAQDAMMKIMDWRVSKDLNFEHTMSGSLKEVNNVINGSGLGYHLENLGAGIGIQDEENVTMLSILTDVYNNVWMMIYADNQPTNLWGHRNTFIRNAKEGQLLSAGVAKYNSDNGFGSYVVELGFFHELKATDAFGQGDNSWDTDRLDNLTKDVKQTYVDTKAGMTDFIGDEYDTTKDEAKRATLKNESNALAKKIADRQAVLNADYAKSIKANADKATAEIAEHKATADKTIADARARSAKKIADAKTMAEQAIATATERLANERAEHKATADKTIADAKSKAVQELADHKALAEKTIKEAEEKRTAGLADNKDVFDKAMASAVDETEEERQARHAKSLEMFKAEEAVKLETLKNRLAKELADLKATQVKDMENLRAKLDKERATLEAKQAEEVKNFPAYIQAEMKKLADKQAKEVKDLEAKHAKEIKQAEADEKKKIENNKGAIKDKNGVTTDKFEKNTDGSITLPNGTKAKPQVDKSGNVVENTFVTEDGTVVKTIKGAKDFLNIKTNDVKSEVGSKNVMANTRMERLHGTTELPNTGSETNVFATLAGLTGLLATGMFLSKRKNG